MSLFVSTSHGRVRVSVLCMLTLGIGLMLAVFGAGIRPAHAAVSPIVSRGSDGVTADALPTVQVDGIVWTQVVVGDTVYAAGQFKTARPAGAGPGTSTVARSNILSFDIRTGELNTDFAPEVNGTVRTLAVSSDKRSLYLGGAFTAVNGTERMRFAAVSLASGALLPIAPRFSNEVHAILATGSTVYVGGYFTKVGSSPRNRLAALTTTGQLRAWRPAADGPVRAFTLTPTGRRSLVVGGSFTKIGKIPACGMARLGLATGSVESWPINTVVKNCGPSTAILSLTADATKVYGSGFSYGGGNYEGVFAASPIGRLVWLQDCRGDTYDVAVANGRVYSVGHAHHCGNIGGFPDTSPRTYYAALAATTSARGTIDASPGGYRTFAGKPSPSLVNWFPTLTPGNASGQSQAAWSVVATERYVVLGGEFTAVNGVPQQGLVRMATAAYAPRKQGPINAYTALKPSLIANEDGSVSVSWKSAWDRDDQELRYELLRDNAVVHSVTADSHRWTSSTMQFLDTTVTPGQHNWKVRTTDPDGNVVVSVGSSLALPQP